MAKNYREYIRIASAQVLLKRGRCPHPQNWKDEPVLYHRCHDCGAFLPFRNPFDIATKGEFANENPGEVISLGGVIIHKCIPDPNEFP